MAETAAADRTVTFTLGDYLRKSRETAGIKSAEQMARLLGEELGEPVSRASINGWERDAHQARNMGRVLEAWAKSPGSADFQNYGDEAISRDGAGGYTVSGHVDSENGFGALLRSDFTCSVSVNGSTFHARVTSITEV